MLENESTVDAGQEEVVEPQSEGEVQSTESVETEVAAVAEEHVQTPEENAKYAEIRRSAEQKSVDKFISDQYGKSHGIHTKADYDKAIAEQRETELLERLRDEDVDPKEIYKNLKENDPEVKAYRQSQQESFISKQIEQLNGDLTDMELDVKINNLDDLSKLPNSDKIIEYVKNGNSLSDAYYLANKKDIIQRDRAKIQNDTIKQIQANGLSTPGSLSDSGQTSSFFTEAQVDAMSQADVNKNLDLIHKSMKSW
ncbi:hypothetical protein [Sulfurimonas sp.]|uniref:hypothetical protein n=1 Tax=Sulfurimonas sp. TaxID=2022749 RepID=UPI003561A615